MQYRRLGKTELDVSVLGFGASPLGEEFGEIDPAAGCRAVHLAIDRGINFFDTSPFYGRTLSEKRLGEALVGRRDKVILATKCGRYDLDSFDFSADRIAKSIDESLKRLQTDYVDVLHLHDIEFVDRRIILEEALPALERVKESGKARYIGITGYPLKLLREVAAAHPVDAVLSYAQYNLLMDKLDGELRAVVQGLGMGLISASPLHLGMLTAQGPPPWHPAPKEVHEAAAHIGALCAIHGEDVAEVALRHALSYPHAASTLVGMATPAQVEVNLEALDGENDPGLMADIAEIALPAMNRSWLTGLPENA